MTAKAATALVPGIRQRRNLIPAKLEQLSQEKPRLLTQPAKMMAVAIARDATVVARATRRPQRQAPLKLEQPSQARLRLATLPDSKAIARAVTVLARAIPPQPHRARVTLEPQRQLQAIRLPRKPVAPLARRVSELNVHEMLHAVKLLRGLLVLPGRLGPARERPEELGAAPIERIVPTLSKIV